MSSRLEPKAEWRDLLKLDFSTSPPCFLAKARMGASVEMTMAHIKITIGISII